MWGYQLHDRPVQDTLFQPEPCSSCGEAGKHGWEMAVNFADAHVSCSQGSFTCRKSTTWDRRLSPPKEGVLRILSPLKSIVPGRVWTRDLGSSGKHANHYTTESNWKLPVIWIYYKKEIA
jgi:hypothetical protein